jgi:hypothetical protein
MAKYKISGVWKDTKGVITHYAFHTVGEQSTSRAEKTSKPDAIKIVGNPFNEAITWIWDYQTSIWKNGEKVEVVAGTYLRSNRDNKVTDNLAHLIDYDWIK